MNLLIWSTESVDTSAMLLAHAMDASFTKTYDDGVAMMLQDADTKLLCYGAVELPDGIINKYGQDRLFQNPEDARELLKKNAFFKAVRENTSLGALKYYKIGPDTAYTSIRDKLGKKFSLSSKIGGSTVAIVSSAAEFKKYQGVAKWAYAHYNYCEKYRVLLGVPDVQAVLGASMSKYKTLSFKEAVMFEGNDDAAAHLQNLFDKGILTDDMGSGFDAWSEEKVYSAEELQDASGHMPVFVSLSEFVHTHYKVDYCAVDVSVNKADNKPIVTNVTSCPSLQSEAVLSLTSEYFGKLIENGRDLTREQLISMTNDLDSKQLNFLSKLIKAAKKSKTA